MATKQDTLGRVAVPARFEETLERLVNDLKEADRYLVFADLPEAQLGRLSEAVDHVRATVWAVLNSLVDEFHHGEGPRLVLTSHRVQRARALMRALSEEIDARRVTRLTSGVQELEAAMGIVYKKLHYLRTGRPIPADREETPDEASR